MSTELQGSSVDWALSLGFLGLATAFGLNLWGRAPILVPTPPVDPAVTNTAPVRTSAAELFRTGGDTSGLACASCHDPGKRVPVIFTNNAIVLAEEHKDLVMAHGRNSRNNHCYNCHDDANLEMLKLRDGRQLKIQDSGLLCGSCHGTTLRDWEAGIHGRTTGFWNRTAGVSTRDDCTSCHDPHAPAFPPLKPGPAPARYRGRIPGTETAPPGAH